MANGDRNFGPITGLSEFTQETGTPVVMGSGIWVPILEITNIQKTTRIHGISISISGTAPTNPAYRISAKRLEDDNFRVVAPYDPGGQTLFDGETDTFVTPIHLPKGSSYKIEIYTDMTMGGATATVDFLNIVEFSP